ncbi:MAG: hypothetical protein JO079_03435 [Frankiaceae bacterium]|nr:hypothetical protein [Frankiaceae bacterium]
MSRARLVASVGIVAVLVAALVLAIVLPAGGRSHASAAAVQRYENAILGPVKDWGSIEVLGMRPSIKDLFQQGKDVLPASAVITESRAWLSAFAHDRALIAAVRPPVGLGRCRALMLRALDKYVEAARGFGQAAAKPLSERRPIVETAVTAASDGDALFDQASAVLQRARRAAGLGVSTNFPNPQS